jgi:hypothetical protein
MGEMAMLYYSWLNFGLAGNLSECVLKYYFGGTSWSIEGRESHMKEKIADALMAN